MPLPAAARRDEKLVRRGFWTKMRRVATRTGFAREAVAAYYCVRDPATPIPVKVVLLSALAYFVLPTDAIPDWPFSTVVTVATARDGSSGRTTPRK